MESTAACLFPRSGVTTRLPIPLSVSNAVTFVTGMLIRFSQFGINFLRVLFSRVKKFS
jgi:hypothetical protein